VALLHGQREPALGVVGPPIAEDVLAQRDLVGQQGGVAGLLEPPHAPVEVARVVLEVERPRRLRRAAAALAPADAIHDRAVALGLSVDAHAAVPLPRLARTRAHAVGRGASTRRAGEHAGRRDGYRVPRRAHLDLHPRGLEPALEVGLADRQPPARLEGGEVATSDRAIDRPFVSRTRSAASWTVSIPGSQVAVGGVARVRVRRGDGAAQAAASWRTSSRSMCSSSVPWAWARTRLMDDSLR
jgi:hypothetical protein